MFAFFAAAIATAPLWFASQSFALQLPSVPTMPAVSVATTSEIADVPYYSQFKDISSPKWQKVGCGVTSLAMVIDYYSNEPVSVNDLLKKGIAGGAYLESAGWKYAGLIQLGKAYGLDGTSYDFGRSTKDAALSQLEKSLKDGPVIASVHYKLDPENPIPHLIVVDGIEGDTVYYTDPAGTRGQKTISTAAFQSAWKKRYIVIRPAKSNLSLLPSPQNYSL